MSYQMNLATNASDKLLSAKSAISDIIVELPDNRIASEARSGHSSWSPDGPAPDIKIQGQDLSRTALFRIPESGNNSFNLL